MTTIDSPCTRICTIDPRTRLCRGCARTLAEIANWSAMPAAERTAVMLQLPHRQKTGTPPDAASGPPMTVARLTPVRE